MVYVEPVFQVTPSKMAFVTKLYPGVKSMAVHQDYVKHVFQVIHYKMGYVLRLLLGARFIMLILVGHVYQIIHCKMVYASGQ